MINDKLRSIALSQNEGDLSTAIEELLDDASKRVDMTNRFRQHILRKEGEATIPDMCINEIESTISGLKTSQDEEERTAGNWLEEQLEKRRPDIKNDSRPPREMDLDNIPRLK